MVRTSPLRRNAEVASNVRRLPEPPWLGGPKAHRPHETGYEFRRSRQW